MVALLNNLVRSIKHIGLFIRRLLDSRRYVAYKDYANLEKLHLFWKLVPYAKQNYASLGNAYDLAGIIETNGIPGCFVECGVWRGGCAAVMAIVANEARSNRKIWLFDSFEGMPEATSMDTGEAAKRLAKGRTAGQLRPVGTNVASIEEVKALFFQKLRMNEGNIFFAKGWFQVTVPKYKSQIGPIAILRIDGDWYESTKVCLENLYDNVVEGGYIIIDDYGWFPGCQRAVDEFLASRHLTVALQWVDYSRVYFRKTAPGLSRSAPQLAGDPGRVDN